jgi:hypothetical protein
MDYLIYRVGDSSAARDALDAAVARFEAEGLLIRDEHSWLELPSDRGLQAPPDPELERLRDDLRESERLRNNMQILLRQYIQKVDSVALDGHGLLVELTKDEAKGQ